MVCFICVQPKNTSVMQLFLYWIWQHSTYWHTFKSFKHVSKLSVIFFFNKGIFPQFELQFFQLFSSEGCSMSLESVWGLISCSLKQRSRSVEMAMLLEPSAEKWTGCVILLFLVAIVRASLIWSVLSASMCAQGQCVYQGCVLQHSRHMRTNLNKSQIFVPWIPCGPARFGLGCATCELKAWKGGKHSNIASTQQQAQTELHVQSKRGRKRLVLMMGKASLLFLLVSAGSKWVSGSWNGAGARAQRPLLTGCFDLHAHPLLAHFLPT